MIGRRYQPDPGAVVNNIATHTPAVGLLLTGLFTFGVIMAALFIPAVRNVKNLQETYCEVAVVDVPCGDGRFNTVWLYRSDAGTLYSYVSCTEMGNAFNRSCWYTNPKDGVRFDNGMRALVPAIVVSTVAVIILCASCVFAVNAYTSGYRNSVNILRRANRADDVADGMYEFLRAHNAYRGADSSVHKAFRKSPIYAPHLTRLVLSFVDGRVAPPDRRPGEVDSLPGASDASRPSTVLLPSRVPPSSVLVPILQE